MRKIEQQVVDELRKRNRSMAAVYIYAITEADYGCEEMSEDQEVMSRVVMVSLDECGEPGISFREIEDSFLIERSIDEKRYVTGELAQKLLEGSHNL